jgi:hypothetical protein
MRDLKKFKRDIFRAAQNPVSWVLSAERLRDGAEAILAHEQAFEIPYFRAHDAATQKAMAIAYSEGNVSGIADIEARVPNYPAAQLLYAYALENLLKGIRIAKDPSLVSGGKLNRKLASHDLVVLAKDAGFVLHVQEIPVAEALSKLSIWRGRYPVALFEADFASAPNADELLDYGSRHSIVRAMYARAHAELSALLPESISNRHGAIVVFRQPGT